MSKFSPGFFFDIACQIQESIGEIGKERLSYKHYGGGALGNLFSLMS
jgi:hypothetical protein